MRCGIVDLGSNTIRLVIYDVAGKHFDKIINERSFSGIVNYVKDGIMSDAGIDRVVSALTELLSLCKLFKSERIDCFATESLRCIKNMDIALKRVKEKTGISIDVITGEQEAYYDYIGLTTFTDKKDLLCSDIGGGSVQIAQVKDGSIAASACLPIGALVVYKRFVAGFYPTDEETAAMEKYLKEQIRKVKFLKDTQLKTLYLIGGTARATVKIHRELFKNKADDDGYRICVEELNTIPTKVKDMGYEGRKMLNTLIPERAHTFIPGVKIIKAIARESGVEEIIVIENGVREGYLIANVIK